MSRRPPTTATDAPPRGVPFVRLDNGDPALMAELLATVERRRRPAAFTLGATVEGFEREFAAWCGSRPRGRRLLRHRGARAGPARPRRSAPATRSSSRPTASSPPPRRSAPSARPRASSTSTRTPRCSLRRSSPRRSPRATRCVIPVHLYGRTVEMEPLLGALRRARARSSIEDACQAHGADYKGRRAGSLGDVGCFSFYPTKNLGAWGDGGAMVTDDPAIAERVRLLRSHGEGSRHHHEMPARTDRLDGLQAAILSVKLRPPRRREPASPRRRRGADRGARRQPGDHPGAGRRGHRPRLPPLRRAHRRARRAARPPRPRRRRQRDPLPDPDPPAAGLRRPRPGPGSLPVAEHLAGEICSLPIFPTITGDEVQRVAAAVAAFEPS